MTRKGGRGKPAQHCCRDCSQFSAWTARFYKLSGSVLEVTPSGSRRRAQHRIGRLALAIVGKAEPVSTKRNAGGRGRCACCGLELPTSKGRGRPSAYCKDTDCKDLANAGGKLAKLAERVLARRPEARRELEQRAETIRVECATDGE